jgi:hypothetical protein
MKKHPAVSSVLFALASIRRRLLPKLRRRKLRRRHCVASRERRMWWRFAGKFGSSNCYGWARNYKAVVALARDGQRLASAVRNEEREWGSILPKR